jgi:polyphosphate glucokinase
MAIQTENGALVSGRTRRGARTRPRGTDAAVTLSIDVGGSHVKVHVLDADGEPLIERLKIETPRDVTPARLVRFLARVTRALPAFDRVSVGLPGIVHRGVVYALPLVSGKKFHGYPLGDALATALGRPVRVANDGEMHGLGLIRRRGVELVLTLGTGLGTALYLDGELGPRLQVITPPHVKEPSGGPYGDEVRRRLGRKRWSRRVEDLIDRMREITNFDHCYVGGGNAERLAFELPDDVTLADNSAAALGGVRLWQWDVAT